MFCESCGEQEATVHLTQVVDGVVKKLHLCEECAEDSGLNIHGPMSLTDMLFGVGGSQEPDSGPDEKACPRCNMRKSDFKKLSRLGCPACYDFFAEELSPLLAAIHKGTQHVGKTPVSARAAEEIDEQISGLQKKLKDAVAEERFEEAAKLRDMIRQEKEKTEGRKAPRRAREGN